MYIAGSQPDTFQSLERTILFVFHFFLKVEPSGRPILIKILSERIFRVSTGRNDL